MIARVLMGLLLLSLWTNALPAEETTPKQAMCRVCELRGAAHGEEDVAASREYEGRSYHFCSESCAEAFDGFPAGYAIHALPRPAPSVAVTTTDDEKITLGSARGGATLVDFWATWCAPCVKAMPELARMQGDFEDSGLRVVGISIDEKPEEFERFLRRNPPGYAVALDSREQPAWFAFSVAAIPSMFLIDADGTIVGEWKGEFDVEDVRSSVDALLQDTTAD